MANVQVDQRMLIRNIVVDVDTSANGKELLQKPDTLVDDKLYAIATGGLSADLFVLTDLERAIVDTTKDLHMLDWRCPTLRVRLAHLRLKYALTEASLDQIDSNLDKISEDRPRNAELKSNRASMPLPAKRLRRCDNRNAPAIQQGRNKSLEVVLSNSEQHANTSTSAQIIPKPRPEFTGLKSNTGNARYDTKPPPLLLPAAKIIGDRKHSK